MRRRQTAGATSSGLGGPSERRFLSEMRDCLRRFAIIGSVERRPHRPRCDRVYADSFVEDILRERFDKRVDGPLVEE